MGLFRKSKEAKPADLPAPPPFDPAKEGLALSQVPRPPVPPQFGNQEIPSPPKFSLEEEALQKTPSQIKPSPYDSLSIPDIRPNMRADNVGSTQNVQEDVGPVETGMTLQAVSREPSPKPIFVSATDYETILEGIDRIKRGLGETEAHIAKILEFKVKQDRMVDEWRSHLEDIQKKLNYVDEVIFRVE